MAAERRRSRITSLDGFVHDQLPGAPLQQVCSADGSPDADSLPTTQVLRDKITFVVGVAFLALTAYWLGNSKTTFYRLYIVSSVVLFGARGMYYYAGSVKRHYFLLDLCYLINLLTVTLLWFLPHPEAHEYSLLAHKVLFAFNSGPLAWSTVALRNSLVLHSFDQMTSTFMHWFPMVVAWTMRWHPDCSLYPPGGCPTLDHEPNKYTRASFAELAILPMLPYLLWATCYYLKLFVFSAKKIQERGYETVYAWMLSKRGALPGFIRQQPKHLQPIVYLAAHLVLCWIGFALSYVMWHSYELHTAQILLSSAAVTWNGATYYFDIFAHKYVDQMKQKPA